MKPLAASLVAAVLLLAGVISFSLPAQVPGPEASTADPTAPPGSTVITSDELNMEQASHTAVFTGSVIVIGTAFKMTCQEMTVYFTAANKINEIISKGDVVILQPGRVTHCGQAHYFRDEDKFILTDQPDILDNKNHIEAPEITIYRTTKKLVTKGRTKTTIIQGIGSSTNSVENPAAPK